MNAEDRAKEMAEQVEGEQMELSLDIETLAQPSKEPGSRKLVMILSISAVFFNPKKVDSFETLMAATPVGDKPDTFFLDPKRSFYAPVSLAQSLQQGFDLDVSTVAFWEKNARDAKSYNMLAEAAACTEDIKETLGRLAEFLKQYNVKRVWAKSPTFDCVLLREAFNKVGIEFPVNWWHERDVRTLMDIGEVKLPFPKDFMLHHALHDAAFEAMQVQELYRSKRETALKLSRLEFYEAREAEEGREVVWDNDAKYWSSKPRPQIEAVAPRTAKKATTVAPRSSMKAAEWTDAERARKAAARQPKKR